MNTRLRAIIVSLRIAAIITAAVIVMALWHLMLWMPWQLDCVMAAGLRARLRIPVRADG